MKTGEITQKLPKGGHNEAKKVLECSTRAESDDDKEEEDESCSESLEDKDAEETSSGRHSDEAAEVAQVWV